LFLACTALTAAGCTPARQQPPQFIPPLPLASAGSGVATPRISGPIAGARLEPQVAASSAPGVIVSTRTASSAAGGGSVTLDFADTDIREVAAQILGNTLHVNYTIDPTVHGTATLRTVTPLSDNQLIPVLQSLLAQNGATLVQNGGVYRVLPAAAAAGIAGGIGTAGGLMVPLRYAAAEDLAKVLQPYAQAGARIVAVPAANALVISGEPAQRDALDSLVRAFDIDELAGQSYALLPVRDGDAQDFATALSQAFRAQQGGQLASVVKVLPLARVNAVLIVASQPRYIEDARRAYAVIERGMHQTTRTWHVYYVQNSTANDTAYILQQAFTPGNVTAQPTSRGTGQPTSGANGVNGVAGLGGGGGGGSGLGSSGSSGSSGGLGSGSSGSSSGGGGLGSAFGGSTGGSGGQGAPTAPASPAGAGGASALLGGLSSSGGSGGNDPNAMRIIPNPENNAVLIYATGEEEAIIEAMLHKIDILPLQVRIDAIIAEVTLTDDLSYGTQFFLDHRALSTGLTAGATTAAGLALPAASGLSGFVVNAAGKDGDFILQALQSVTTVKVLSSPNLLVLDNETAALEVGNLVPYQTGSLTAAAGTGGLVTLDIAQEVSGIANNSGTSSTSGSTINSPTFTERAVKSRVVVQDGQTIGLAGLITDNDTRQNSGLPFLKNIPIVNLLTSQQTNTRSRTELLILLTPHVLHDQRDARALTEDLREQLPNSAIVPFELNHLPASGSADPSRSLRKSLGSQ
jgi:general secretion pathway protein D